MIEKTKLMTILFETDDLQYASPSTVSRCGIIYIHQSQEQWKSLHLSFVQVLHSIGLIDIYMTLFDALVDWLMPAALEILNDCRSPLAITATQKYKVCDSVILMSPFFLRRFIDNRLCFHIDFQPIFSIFRGKSTAAQSNLVPTNLFVLFGMGIWCNTA